MNIMMLLVLIPFAPSVIQYYAHLWQLPHYDFFPLALVGAMLLARRAWNERGFTAPPNDARMSRVVATGLLITSFAILTAAIGLNSPWLGTAAVLLLPASWTLHCGGLAGFWAFAPAGVMLLVTLRPPLNFDLQVIGVMQRLAASLAGATLDVLGTAHVRAGNVLEIPGRRLLVEEACSGVNSLLSAVACTTFYLLWTKRHPFVWFMLLGLTPLWVVFANTLRLVLVAELRTRWDIAADEGTLHTALGLAVFLLTMGLIVSTDGLLRFYAAVLPESKPQERMPNPVAPPIASLRAVDSVVPKTVVVFAMFLTVLQLPALAPAVRDWTVQLTSVELRELGPAAISEANGDWRRTGYETLHRDRSSAFGEHSQLWKIADERTGLLLSLDYPFIGWHELTECYQAQGWQVASRQVVRDEGAAVKYVAVRMSHPQTARFGYLLFYLVKQDGRPIPPRERGEVDELADRLRERFLRLRFWKSDPADVEAVTFQLQAFVESYVPLNADESARVDRLFLAETEKLRRAMAEDRDET